MDFFLRKDKASSTPRDIPQSSHTDDPTALSGSPSSAKSEGLFSWGSMRFSFSLKDDLPTLDRLWSPSATPSISNPADTPDNATHSEQRISAPRDQAAETSDPDDGVLVDRNEATVDSATLPSVYFLVNKRSGGAQGDTVLEKAHFYWPETAIFLQDTLMPAFRNKGKHGPSHSAGDLNSSHSSASSLCSSDAHDDGGGDDDELCHVLQRIRTCDCANTRLVSAGGDGTVSWVANLVTELGLPNIPPIALLPLGTGNELARCLGWGPSCSPWMSNLEGFLTNVQNGPILDFDCWMFSVHSSDPKSPFNRFEDMFCFFSVGFDANIANEFHSLREENPTLCSTVAGNKMIHTLYGAKQFFVPERQLSESLSLEVDGKQIPIPNGCRTIQVLNIHSSADGTDFFGINPSNRFHASNDEDFLKEYKTPKPNDQLLEVVATDGIHHFLAIKMGLSHSRRLAQGKHIRIVYDDPNKPISMQLDGDPWMQSSAVVEISFASSVPLVLGPLPKSGGVENAE